MNWEREYYEGDEKEGPRKRAFTNTTGKPELSVRAATGARHLHPSDNTPTYPLARPRWKGVRGETTKSDGENRGGFSTRSGAGGETQGGEGGDWLAARSYGGSYGSANVARGKRGERRVREAPSIALFPPHRNEGISRGSPRGAPLAGGGAHARDALDFVSPPDFS